MTIKATDAVAKSANAADAVFEIVGHIPATTLASWGMTEGEVRLVLPGEPISGWTSLRAPEVILGVNSDHELVSGISQGGYEPGSGYECVLSVYGEWLLGDPDLLFLGRRSGAAQEAGRQRD
jgi:hypothetical protein